MNIYTSERDPSSYEATKEVVKKAQKKSEASMHQSFTSALLIYIYIVIYRIVSIKCRTLNKRWVQINAGSTRPNFK